MQAGDRTRMVVAKVSPPVRNKPKRVWLYARLPQPAKIASVEIGGRPWTKFDPAQERIELPESGAPLKMTIRY
jgi:hypothetical protein